jgi:CHASE3 domain sensor protein
MRWTTEKKIMAGAGLVLVILLINAMISYRATRKLIENEQQVAHTYEVLGELENIRATINDAETGERGYLLTGETSYLAPYQSAVGAIHAQIKKLRQSTAGDPYQQERIPALEHEIDDRLDNLKNQINRQPGSREGGHAQNERQVALSGVGKRQMDDLRRDIAGMEGEENDLLKRRAEESKASGRDAYLTDFVANLIACALLSSVSYIAISDATARKRAEEALRQQREWLQVTLSSIGDAVIATDTNGNVSFLNPIAETLTGWERDEAQG